MRTAPGAIGLGVALLAFAALRAYTVFHEAFNWDEFALFYDVARTASEGRLYSGGHPGLPQVALLALVSDCVDEIGVGRAARLAWLALSWGYLAGVFVLLRELLPDDRHRFHDALLGTALLGLLPAFLEWSIQVRTDQVALVGGTWGAAGLVASRRRPWLALPAGLALGLGWLGTQKLAYVAALAGLLAAGDLFLRSEWRTRRELTRGAGALLAAGLVVGAWQLLVRTHFEVHAAHAALKGADPSSVRSTLDVFDFYRQTIGYSQYAAALPTLVPHAVLLLAMLGATVASGAARTRRLALAWAVLALGLGVGLFHAAAFAYFLMTLGLFAAIALALALPSVRTALSPRGDDALRLATPILWAALLLGAGLQSIDALRDTQSVQRDSLRFVHRNFSPDRAGFQPETALFCGVRQPIGTWFSQTIYRTFEGPSREQAVERMLERFRSEPVHYLVQSFRLNQFPAPLRRFWSDHYQPYHQSVFLAGRRLSGNAGESSEFELLFAAPYRWLPLGEHPLAIDGETIAPGEVRFLAKGAHTAGFTTHGARGLLVLAVDDPPSQSPLAFYDPY